MENLRSRERVLDYDELAIAAWAKDPAIYPDLMWHAKHASSDHNTILTELTKCPGFNLDELIDYAWRRARYGLLNDSELASWAMERGHKDALQTATLHLEDQMSESTRKRSLDRTRKIVTFTGTNKELQSWLLANLGQFEFDDAQKKFVLH
jgi:hypothetical protein